MGVAVNKKQDEYLSLARTLGMKVVDALPSEIPSTLFEAIPYALAKKHTLFPIAQTHDKMVIVIANPLNLNALDDIRLLLDREVEAFCAPKEVILEGINTYYHHKLGATKELITDLKEESRSTAIEESEEYDLLEVKDEAPIIRLLNLILSEAIDQGASDIHFEPSERDLRIRYRIDGVLQSRHSPPSEYQAQLLTRVKVMAKLDIAEHRLPQDGRIKLKMGGREIDFRVSTIPTAYGERIVLRILDKGNVILGLDKLGMLPVMYDQFLRLISLPEGIVLVTGPTGSGKTTTLYSALCEISSDESNIMTIEDPVEYKLKGIAQIGVHPKIGLTFAKGLRHILRQDPDKVMVGEIRDKETAEIAIQAALTGHLVLSTLHTNDAPSALPRLVDMGIEPYLLSSSVAGVLAQRLVRKVCSNCREGYEPGDLELEEIGLSRDELIANRIYRGKGCPACFGSGYKGRHGIYELMVVDQKIQTQIAKSAEAGQLRDMAFSQKEFTTLRQHGAHLVRGGITTVAEVLRVTRKHEFQNDPLSL